MFVDTLQYSFFFCFFFNFFYYYFIHKCRQEESFEWSSSPVAHHTHTRMVKKWFVCRQQQSQISNLFSVTQTPNITTWNILYFASAHAHFLNFIYFFIFGICSLCGPLMTVNTPQFAHTTNKTDDEKKRKEILTSTIFTDHQLYKRRANCDRRQLQWETGNGVW